MLGFDTVLTKELLLEIPHQAAVEGYVASHTPDGWAIVPVYRAGDPTVTPVDDLTKDVHSGTVILTSAEIAALPPVAELLEALSDLLVAMDEYDDTWSVPQFAMDEPAVACARAVLTKMKGVVVTDDLGC